MSVYFSAENDRPMSQSVPWVVALIVGICALVLGVAFLFNLKAAVGTMVLLVATSLVLTGVGELALSEKRGFWEWCGAGLLIAAGVLAFAWPGATLWVISVIAGIGLLGAGIARVLASVFEDGSVGERTLLGIGGVIAFIAGIVALVWPSATVLVLAIIFGVRTMLFGVTALALARRLHDDQQMGVVR